LDVMMISRNVVRGIASAAAARSSSSVVSSVEESVSRLDNGFTVASVDLHGAATQLVVSYRAGARYQQPFTEDGLVHHLRNCVGIDSSAYFGSSLLWELGNIGGNLVSSASKDLFTVRLSVARTHADTALHLVGEFAKPSFKEWDVFDDVLSTVKEDLVHEEPFDLLVELLHKAAFRDSALANSLLAPPYAKITPRQLSVYGESRLVPSEGVLVGVNVDHSVLLEYATKRYQKQEHTAKEAQPSKYFGGDNRVHGGTRIAHVAIAGQGGKLSDIKSVAIQSVLSFVIGKGPNVKFASTPGIGPVVKSVLQASNQNPVGINALNILHSDNGLLGVYLAADGEKIGPLVKAAVAGLKELASSGVDAETLSIAKKFAEVKTFVNSQDTALLAVDRATQLLAAGNALSPSEFVKAVQEVSAEDVKKAAAQVTSKLTLAAYGRIHQVPYLDQL